MPGGWEGSDRKSRLPADWLRRVAEVKRRASGRCQKRLPSGRRCPRPGVEVDHIVPNDDHGYGNLRLLCTEHHARKSSREGNAARWAKKRPRVEEHPPLR